MDEEELVETKVPSVGERLRAAREAKGLSLEDIAAQTRIPRRHLEAIEAADWDRLPAPTYTVGFARNYASVVGLDRAEIADQLRTEMGGTRPATTTEIFEPADPARTMPKSLVIGAILAVILLVVAMSWLNRRSLEASDEPANPATARETPAAPAPTPAAPPPAAASQPVVLTATDAVWLQVYERGGATLFSGTLQPGQIFAVPTTSTAPLLKTGKPEALRITVGNTIAPAVGPPATTVNDVSLLPGDLLRTGQAAAPQPQAAPPAVAQPRTAPTERPATPPPAPAPTDNSTGV
ncbi:MAG TPA: RodZ domain-containing protein [Sphingomicrobium sp.]|nr:RodZ domain-containing protein [Sphingomicrobium sp.]